MPLLDYCHLLLLTALSQIYSFKLPQILGLEVQLGVI